MEYWINGFLKSRSITPRLRHTITKLLHHKKKYHLNRYHLTNLYGDVPNAQALWNVQLLIEFKR